MPRRPAISATPSLFPFLSVLLCLLGVLIFLAAAITPSSLSSARKSIELEIESSVDEHRTPVVIECLKDRARLADGSMEFTRAAALALNRAVGVAQSPREAFAGDPFGGILATAAQSGGGKYLLFIVRPEGVETFGQLRAVLDARNDAFTRSEVPLFEKPSATALEAIPRALAARMRFENARLSFARKMTAAERDQVRALFSGPGARAEVDRLFELTQKVAGWLDYGFELLPADIAIDKVRFVEAPAKPQPPKKP